MSIETQAPEVPPPTEPSPLAEVSNEALIALEYELWNQWEMVQEEFWRRGQTRQRPLNPRGAK